MKEFISSVICLFFVMGCNTPQSHKLTPQTDRIQKYQIAGSWRIEGIEEKGQYTKAKPGEDVVLIFAPSGLKIFVAGESIEEKIKTGIGRTEHTIKNNRLTLKDTNGERFEADIDFFGPESFRLSNYGATQKMGAVFMAIRAALTGRLVEENSDQIKHSYLYFKKTDSIGSVTKEISSQQTQVQKTESSISKPKRYVANGFNLEIAPEGLVYDKKTGLMWAQKDNRYPTKWNDAEAYCRNYRGGGYDDWRVPTIRELSTLYHKNEGYSVQNGRYSVHLPEHINITGGWIVASDTFGLSSGYVFSFVDGKKTFGYKTAEHKDVRILPVRLSPVLSGPESNAAKEDAIKAGAAGLEILNLIRFLSVF